MDGVALDVHAENLLGLSDCVVGAVGHLDTARLASASGLDLSFNHDAGLARRRELFGDGTHLLGRARHLSLGYRNPIFREECLRLVFEQVHEGPSL